MTHSLESAFPSGDPGPRSVWWWRLEDAAGEEVGSEVAGEQRFGSQADAESWVGEVWQELLEDGVEQVTLFEADREVYGPMSLRPSR